MMATRLSCFISKTKENRQALLVMLLSLVCYSSLAQTLVLQQSIPITQPGAISIDRLQNIYVADKKNNLFKLDAAGKVLQTYSPAIQGNLANIEAWNLVRILLFHDDRQQITLLDRFLVPLSTTRLSDFTQGIIRTATLASDDRIWLFNESDFNLLKTDLNAPENSIRTPLNLILNATHYDIKYMREYQNNLYLVDKASGIYIFDNMGNYRKKIPIPGLAYIGFKGDNLYYTKDNSLFLLNLYNLKETSIPFPVGKTYNQSLITDTHYYLFSDSQLDIYKVTP